MWSRKLLLACLFCFLLSASPSEDVLSAPVLAPLNETDFPNSSLSETLIWNSLDQMLDELQSNAELSATELEALLLKLEKLQTEIKELLRLSKESELRLDNSVKLNLELTKETIKIQQSRDFFRIAAPVALVGGFIIGVLVAK